MAIAFVTGGSGYVGRNLIRALVARGDEVRALARSPTSQAVVAGLGAAPVAGDLDDVAAMTEAMRGAAVVYHAAAVTDPRASRAEYQRVVVDGTEHVIAAARAAGVPRLVHVGTEAVLADGKPIVRADETRPGATRPAGLYPWSKGLAEARVIAANGNGLGTVVVRPRFIWGGDDTSVLARLVEGVRAGRLRWIGGGRYLTSSCHIANVVEGTLLAAERGTPGEIYFLTDGEPVELRAFLTDMLRTQGVDAGRRTVPRWLARLAVALTGGWKRPLLGPEEYALFGVEVTVDDRKARRDLGYRATMTRERGLAEMKAAGPVAPS